MLRLSKLLVTSLIFYLKKCATTKNCTKHLKKLEILLKFLFKMQLLLELLLELEN